MSGLSEEGVLYALFAFIRVGAILFSVPIFGDHPTPVRVRILLGVAVTIVIFPMIPQVWFRPVSNDLLLMVTIILREILVGLAIGYLSKLAFDALLMAASIVGYQMGFGTANIVLADQVQQINGFEALHKMLIMLIFLSLDLHIFFLNGINDSFAYIPLGIADMGPGFIEFTIGLSGQIFMIALKLGAPVLVALMFTMAALGLVARSVPQINIFTMSFPTSFFIGLIVYIVSIPLFPEWFSIHFTRIFTDIFTSLGGMAN